MLPFLCAVMQKHEEGPPGQLVGSEKAVSPQLISKGRVGGNHLDKKRRKGSK